MLTHLLNYKDCKITLRLARETANIHNNSVKVSFYPDFLAEVQRKGVKFNDVKKRLRVTARGQTHLLEPAPEAASWLDHNEQSLHYRRAAGRKVEAPFVRLWTGSCCQYVPSILSSP